MRQHIRCTRESLLHGPGVPTAHAAQLQVEDDELEALASDLGTLRQEYAEEDVMYGVRGMALPLPALRVPTVLAVAYRRAGASVAAGVRPQQERAAAERAPLVGEATA